MFSTTTIAAGRPRPSETSLLDSAAHLTADLANTESMGSDRRSRSSTVIRKLILKVHLYLALVTGIFILIAAITGAALVFEQEIDHTINRKSWHVTPGQRTLPLETLVERFHAQYPNQHLDDIVIAQQPDLAYRFRMGGPGDVDAMMNPYTGDSLGTRDFTRVNLGSGLARLLHVIHTRLLAGEAGEEFVGAITVATLFILVTGLYLWWGRKILHVLWRASWKRVNFDLHNIFGFYALVFLVYVALSGIMISFERFTDPFVRKHLNTHSDVVPRVKSAPLPGAKRISLDDAVRAGDAALPGSVTTIINVPKGPTEAFRLTRRFPEDRAAAGRSRLYLDQYTGRVFYLKSTRTDDLGTRIVNIKRAVHTGDLYGWPTRIVAFLSCLFLAGQIITGFLIWRKKVQVPLRRQGGTSA